ncbi:MAG: hypothetical protein IT262_03990 [Saprospiraceae bacterium]|nr:hypothetical protein [Saprospiraceae bacterium]
MFQRQAREPFPARNIIILAALVLAGLFYVLKSLKEDPAPAPQAPPALQE